MDAQEFEQFARVVATLEAQSRLTGAQWLQGGVSARVAALEVARVNGQVERLIVRQHGAADRRANPQIAADEFRLLRLLRKAGLAVPEPYAVDASGEIFPTPYLVIEYVDGAAEFNFADRSDALRQMAYQLARIHRITRANADLSFLPREAESAAKRLERPEKLDDSIREGAIRDAIARAGAPQPRNPDVLLHGDYWLGNILWKAGRLVAIIDWEDAQVGDPLADLANARLEIAWMLGLEAMREFTELYHAQTPFDLSDLPYRDLIAALKPAFKISEWAANAQQANAMRKGHALFAQQALEALNAQR